MSHIDIPRQPISRIFSGTWIPSVAELAVVAILAYPSLVLPIGSADCRGHGSSSRSSWTNPPAWSRTTCVTGITGGRTRIPPVGVALRDTTPALDPTDTMPPPRLTTDLVARVGRFLTALAPHQAQLKPFATDSAYFTRFTLQHDDFPGLLTGRAAGPRAVLDYGRLAATVPAVAQAFTTAQLAPADYLPFVKALAFAEATDSLQTILEGFQDNPVAVADTETPIWQNVVFLRTHRPTIDALGLTIPKIAFSYNRGAQAHFLDTSALAKYQYRIQPMMDTSSGFPIGFLDSAEAPAGSGGTALPPWRVLFIGNSLTYFNTMPRLFSRVAARGLHCRVVVGLVSVPAASPFVLWTTTDVQQVIARLPWDAVVVQLKPTGANTPVNFQRYARLFAQQAMAHHARVALWTQYREPETSAETQDTLNHTLATAARAAGASVIPIPAAWDTVQRAANSTWHALYYALAEGNTHPSALGSYLIALTAYRTLTGHSPVGLSHVIDTLTIPTPTAALLQHAAATAQP